MKEARYENYPLRIIMLSNFVSTATYAIGAFIIYQIGIIWFVLYLIYIMFLEIRLLTKSCVYCYYHNKSCAFGRGKLCSILFKRKTNRKFNELKLTWKDIIPDFMISIIPLILGIILLIKNFTWLILSLIILLFILMSAGNALIRNSFACRHCKQLEEGCPAAQLFNKPKK
ncbi:MAG: hypothetical protein JW983_05205 [Elusimicrobia bacterium]|nr:hypothetical protein [Elusimicrobiota bacterium]